MYPHSRWRATKYCNIPLFICKDRGQMSGSPFIIGKLSESWFSPTQSKEVEWKMPYIPFGGVGLSLKQRVSPSFTFKNTSLHFVLDENYSLDLYSSREIHILFTDPIQYSFSIKDLYGNLIGTRTFTSTFGKTVENVFKYSVSNVLEGNKSLLTMLKARHDLVIVCRLRIVSEATKTDNLKEKSTTEPLHRLRLAGVSNFFKGLKEVFLNEKYSDFALNVQGKEFKAHKIILAAHSPVFEAMLEHDMTEKNTNSVNIEDCEPDIFSDFLNFLYTGDIDNLNSDNALDLYEVADKYQVTDLSSLCMKYMMDNISIENFTGILNLGLRHQLKELIKVATEFFSQNSKEIVVTAEWITFLSQNPVAGNELFLKVLHLGK